MKAIERFSQSQTKRLKLEIRRQVALENGEVYLRYETNGQPYFAVKYGMLLCAIITPMQMFSEGFMQRLEDLRDLCRIQYQNEKAKQLADETQIKMSEAAGED